MNEHWVDVCNADDISDEIPLAMPVDGYEIALYRVDGEVYATDNLCTHGSARLCDGFLEGHEIECPLHQGRFDVRDGRALCAPLTADIRTYAVRREGERVYVRIGLSS
ncbi:Naphthalene 1,2-dioxygenase/salicylate 5-hydroxylase systems, ferredoxin component [Paraburkholderia ultramafica]|uniref:Naphthalene 1,2-dioxygenase/salicylate 5-hydroxylase systems, ferredoxin component n=1 Tax=Paraburkholderia ultramafica TaxID=1544867 RepID=A0A6S7BNL2_9BURK|nr:non-heme iron oxygenase ferredoxin subunit [Paraburkholderia ultramafica]CAB3807041.1 Naphthalene 1,2-dioxygenase/salicylate 5-hydroxylase systems, ferredoxin component [Paraburkholderia ultramafica]